MAEGADAAFTLSRTGATAAALTVAVAVSETGAVLKDASAVPSSVTFAADAVTATLALETDDDDTDDDAGTVTVTLGTGTGYTVGEAGAATVAVSDNDVPVDFVLAVPATVAEDAGPATVTVTATTAENAPPATALAVQLARVGGTATGGTDYDAVSVTARFQVSDFAAATVDGQPRYRAEWTHDVVIHDDEEVEDDETVVLEMSPTSAFVLIHTLHGAHDAVRATLTIVDDDLPVVTIAADTDTGTVIELEGAVGFTLSRTGPTAATLTVTVEVTQQVDRDLLPDGAEAVRTVTFAVGSATTALRVTLDDDDLDDVNGTLTVEVQAGSGYTVGDPGSATVSVIDLDTGLPQPANLMAEAGSGVGEVALSWDAHAPGLVFARHQYRYKTDGDYAAWTDIPDSGQHDTGAGDGSNLTGYTVTGLVGGQVHTFQVRTYTRPSSVSDPSDEATATPRSVAVSFGAGSYSVDEGGTVEVTVQLDAAPGREVVVPVSAAGAGGATPPGETGADWSGVPENVTFGATDTEQTFTLAATDDTDVDAGESVALSFGTLPAGVTAGTPSEATVTIVDNDAVMTPTCTLNAGDLWCGVVTVGTTSDGVGFVAAETETDTDVGALTDNDGDQTITIGSDGYTISSLLVRNSPVGALSIDLDVSFPTDDVATLEFYIVTSAKTFKVSEAIRICHWRRLLLDRVRSDLVRRRPRRHAAFAAGGAADGDDRGGQWHRGRGEWCRRLHAEPDRVDGGGADGAGGGDAAGGPRLLAGRGGGGAHGDVRGGQRDGGAERGAGERRSRRGERRSHCGGAGGLGLHGGRPGLGHRERDRYGHRTAAAGEPDGVGGGGGRRGGVVLGRARAGTGVRPSPVPVQDGRGLRRVDGYSEQWATHRRCRGWFEPDRLHGDRPGGRAVAHLPGADVQLVE